MLEEKERGNSVPSLFHLQTLNASSNRGEKDRTCFHWQSFSHHWDKDLAMWCSIPSLGLRTSLAPHGRLPLLRETALADISSLTGLHHSYSASFSLDTCTGDGSTSLGII